MLNQWFHIKFDDTTVCLEVEPPGQEAWTAQFAWGDISRVCFEASDWGSADNLYIFTTQRPESYLLSTEADGAWEFWHELIRRKLFDMDLAIRIVTATEGLYCWPEVPLAEA